MKNILIVNSNVYGAKTGGGTVADISEANLLLEGSYASFDANGALLPAAVTASDLEGVNELILAVGTTGNSSNISVPIPIKVIRDFNKTSPTAYTKPILKLVVAPEADSVGEASFGVYNKSYTSQYAMDTVKASVHKTKTMTNAVLAQKLADKLNVPDSFVVATVSTNEISITPKDVGITISTTTGGLIEFADVTTTTAIRYGVGQGMDVIQIEKDFAVFKGDGGYVERSENWFSVPTQTNVSGQYTLYNLLWTGIHDTPTSIKAVMSNQLMIAVISTGAAIVTHLDALVLALNPVPGVLTP